MYGLTTVTVLQLALLATTGSEYQAAYNRAEAEGKPLLVLVGTDKLPDCRVMKEHTMPELNRSGALNEIVFAEVDSDTELGLARQMLRGDSLPQLVLYTQVGKLWRRTHLSGVQSPGEIRAFLQREIAKGREVAEQARRGKTTVSYSQSDVTFSYSPGGS